MSKYSRKHSIQKSLLLISPLPPPAGGISTWTELVISSRLRSEYKIKLVDIRILGKRANLSRPQISLYEIWRTVSILTNVFVRVMFGSITVAHLNSSLYPLGMFRDLICALIIKARCIPLVVQYHGSVNSINRKMAFGIPYKVLEMLHRLAQRTIVLSHESERASKLLSAKERVTVLPNFVDLTLISNYRAIRAARGSSDNEITVVYVGGLARQKGLVEILELAQQFPTVRFRLVGHRLPESSEVLKCQTENIELEGSVSRYDTLRIMAESDIFLFPSHQEGFPMAVLEAMAIGLPVVATNVGAIPEMIEDRGGIVCDIGDVSALSKAVQWLINTPTARFQFGVFNVKKVDEYYSSNRVISALINVYDSVIN